MIDVDAKSLSEAIFHLWQLNLGLGSFIIVAQYNFLPWLKLIKTYTCATEMAITDLMI
jgi:hypothetical protein